MAEQNQNRLAGETSPYLLQHSRNPVDWYPWGPEALKRAKEDDRPILLSIGYAACHWCHVMERESFENDDTASYMNEHFVSIKVDREERPDIDSIYMDAVQALSGHGGWPMTVFLTPDGEPFYGGTYFPPEDRHGMPSFRRVLEGVAEAWRERRPELEDQGRQLAEAMGQTGRLSESSEPLTEEVLRAAFAGLERAFDPQWGGFGAAPKFPQPMTTEFLLRCHLRAYPNALEMARVTLDRMASGGMYDQVGGGFHRYSVDGRWHVPHFEKMLYDNAQLARLYTHGWQVTERDLYRQVASETLEYLIREMRDPSGGFYSSQDADSEGVEGKFYVWGWDELVDAADREVARYFGATPEGNWEGTNVLWTPFPAATVAAEAGLPEEELMRRVAQSKGRLLARREERVRPGTDDKILASWNGLAISALAEGGRALHEPRYVEAAEETAQFLLAEMRRPDGRLLRSWRQGRAGGPAYLDDYALVAEGLLRLSEATLDLRWLEEARSLAGDMLRLFRDQDRGGFFQTGTDGEALVVRPKDLFDNAVPSGNSVAAGVLLRLALLYGDAGYEKAGASALRLVRDHMVRAPTGFGHALGALDLYLSRAKEVALIGDPAAEDTMGLAEVAWTRYLPNAVLAGGSPDDSRTAAVPLLAGRPQLDGVATAYVCENFACQVPVTEPERLAEQLSS